MDEDQFRALLKFIDYRLDLESSRDSMSAQKCYEKSRDLTARALIEAGFSKEQSNDT